jgi:hypothetical protein
MFADGYKLYTDPTNGFTFSLTLAQPKAAEVIEERCNVSTTGTSPIPSITLPTSTSSNPHHPMRVSSPTSPLRSHLYIAASTPAHLLHTRVQVSDARLSSLQLYTNVDEFPPVFCMVNIKSDAFGRAETHTCVPKGTVRAFAIEMWRKMFRLRTGREWQDVMGGGEHATTGEWKWDGRDVVWTVGDEVANTSAAKPETSGKAVKGDVDRKRAGKKAEGVTTDKKDTPLSDDCQPGSHPPLMQKTPAPLNAASGSKFQKDAAQSKNTTKGAVDQPKRLQSASELKPATANMSRKAVQSKAGRGKEAKSQVVKLSLPRSTASKTKATSAANASMKNRHHWTLCPVQYGKRCTCWLSGRAAESREVSI